ATTDAAGPAPRTRRTFRRRRALPGVFRLRSTGRPRGSAHFRANGHRPVDPAPPGCVGMHAAYTRVERLPEPPAACTRRWRAEPAPHHAHRAECTKQGVFRTCVQSTPRVAAITAAVRAATAATQRSTATGRRRAGARKGC